tara:strand:- start:957 stop:2072 length:1116 start_codon:yes stop_codon:yes gene_type:complete
MAPTIYCRGFFLSLSQMVKSKNSYKVIGVMSGTSLDGIDICFVTYFFNSCDWDFTIHYSQTVKYDQGWINKLKKAHKLNEEDLSKLDFDYTIYLANSISDFIDKNQIQEIDFISSHGHTVFHDPEEKITYQIGNRSELSKNIGLPVICDFRIQDVQLGGQGAPLVPIGDLLLFKDYSHCLNLGGFSNISVKYKNKIIAYDICPVNIVLNNYSRLMGFSYDLNGRISKSGQINNDLLQSLNSITYYNMQYPKSLSIEWVENKIFPIINSFNIQVKDILRTFVEHIAIQINNNLHKSKPKLLITGGGAKNDFLMSRIKRISGIDFELVSENIIDYKEAIIFGFLGVLKIRNENNCLKSVTGASHDHCSGVIFE